MTYQQYAFQVRQPEKLKPNQATSGVLAAGYVVDLAPSQAIDTSLEEKNNGINQVIGND